MQSCCHCSFDQSFQCCLVCKKPNKISKKKMIDWKSSISTIISNLAISGNNTNALATSSMYDFVIMKKFNGKIHPLKAPQILEVIWQPPVFHWTKCNTDETGTSTSSSYGGIFRNKDANFLLCFSENLGPGNAFFAELSGAMRAIELAKQYNWFDLWLETDSELVVKAFSNHKLVPCNLRNKWRNCILILSSVNFVVSHVYREEN